MFKLAAFTDEISQDLARACQVLAEFGGKGIEIRAVWDTRPEDLSDSQVAEIKKIVADHGLSVCSIGSPFGKCELDDSKAVAHHMDILKRCADIARELDCPLVRGFAFWDPDQADQKPWKAMVKAYQPVPAILKDKDILLGLENEASCYVGTASHIRTFMDLLKCDRVKAVWDPANHIHDPQSIAIPAFPDGYQLVRDDMVHVHVKDAGPDEAGVVQNRFMGTGLVHWENQLQALKNDGYDGYISLETHVRAEEFPPELEDTYGHYLAAGGKEGASKVCLAWLSDAMAALT